jgi:large conductance mechanosensitive channel
MLKEFKEFAIKGNMLDLAVGVMLGTAFGAVVSSLVKDIFMPPLGKMLGGVDFSDLFFVLGSDRYQSLEAAKTAGAATINYGVFVNAVINFLVVAWALFFVAKVANAARRPAPPAAPSERECPFCASQIPVRATRCAHCTSTVPAVDPRNGPPAPHVLGEARTGRDGS